eukprot:CAMPEP_0181309168 /NCGR_PEP_ID=MMETSP1101-20121128/11869_1 /TAXON_ID=46948 /ORGANISM="Rhodomonas abbreviata, Strain Caron Lab Isolate" /LENGTH=351 /DNA_ID=CAMNT_0023415633 /DNA_START=205 /DNA_END=1257 /DNA_ORIENTATION=-
MSPARKKAAMSMLGQTSARALRVLFGVCLGVLLCLGVVAHFMHSNDRHDMVLAQVAVDPRLQPQTLRRGVFIALFQTAAALFRVTPLYEELNSVLVEAGGSKWKVLQTDVLSKKFFGGLAEGVTHVPSGGSLIFSGKELLRRTKLFSSFQTEVLNAKPIPSNFSALGYDHIGDISTIMYQSKELVLASVEEPSYNKPLLMVFSADDLQFLWAGPLNQHHSSFLAVDDQTMIMYSSEFTNVVEMKRYQFPSCVELPPLPLKKNGVNIKLQGVQGATVYNGLLYISTNQRLNDGDIYALNTTTGEITYSMDLELGMGLAEMEGIDIAVAGGRLRMLVSNNFLNLFTAVTELEW